MIIALSDFNNLSEKEKKETLQDLKTQMGVSGIVKEWDISRSKAYGMLKELDIPMNPKGFKGSKTKTVSAEGEQNIINSIQADQTQQTLPDATKKKKNKSQKNLNKTSTPASTLEFNLEDNLAKFSLYMETQGTTTLISETLQMLLGSEKLTNTNLHMNITLQEI